MRSHTQKGENANVKLGQAIRQRRKSLGLNQSQTAALAGCTRLFVSKAELGKSTLRLDKLLSLLRVLGLQFTLETGKQGLRVEVDDEGR